MVTVKTIGFPIQIQLFAEFSASVSGTSKKPAGSCPWGLTIRQCVGQCRSVGLHLNSQVEWGQVCCACCAMLCTIMCVWVLVAAGAYSPNLTMNCVQLTYQLREVCDRCDKHICLSWRSGHAEPSLSFSPGAAWPFGGAWALMGFVHLEVPLWQNMAWKILQTRRLDPSFMLHFAYGWERLQLMLRTAASELN